MQTTASPITGDQLTHALHALGIRFILPCPNVLPAPTLRPNRLIAELAQSSEARLRLSLVPLFLEHPEYAAAARAIYPRLPVAARLTLACYYTAAYWLQRKHHQQIEDLLGKTSLLPDHFSHELALATTPDPDQNLALLAQRQRELSDLAINWLGTYQHAAQVWLRALTIERA